MPADDAGRRHGGGARPCRCSAACPPPHGPFRPLDCLLGPPWPLRPSRTVVLRPPGPVFLPPALVLCARGPVFRPPPAILRPSTAPVLRPRGSVCLPPAAPLPARRADLLPR